MKDDHGCATMTLNEAIEHCKEKEDCSPCGAEHRQLRQWLENYQFLCNLGKDIDRTKELIECEFKNKVVQFFNDNLNDLHGNVSTLYQEIAHDVFDMKSLNGVMFCTDIEAKVGMPLGEWP